MLDAEEAQEVEDLSVPAVGIVGSPESAGTFGADGFVAKLLQREDPEQLQVIQRMQAEAAMDEEQAGRWLPSGGAGDRRRPPDGRSDAGADGGTSSGGHAGVHRSIAKWGGHHQARASPAALPPSAPGARRSSGRTEPRMAEIPRRRDR